MGELSFPSYQSTGIKSAFCIIVIIVLLLYLSVSVAHLHLVTVPRMRRIMDKGYNTMFYSRVPDGYLNGRNYSAPPQMQQQARTRRRPSLPPFPV